ncbi:hypothetical protein SB861_70240, partial [Paraburkholderia sp. SIMBA_049]
VDFGPGTDELTTHHEFRHRVYGFNRLYPLFGADVKDRKPVFVGVAPNYYLGNVHGQTGNLQLHIELI